LVEEDTRRLCFLEALLTFVCFSVMDQFESAHKGDIQKLRVVLTVDNVDDLDSMGWTALHHATYRSHFECVKCCIEMKANVNARDLYGWTPLYMAAMYGNIDIVRILLDSNAIVDVSAKDKTALFIAIYNNSVDVARLLVERGAKVSNVELTKGMPVIPDWVTAYVMARSTCRNVSITMIGIHKYRRTNVTGNNDVNVLRLVSKHIWSSRMDDMWSQALH
jgi:ankyrin repeat protein